MALEHLIQDAFSTVQETYCHPPLHGLTIIQEQIEANGIGAVTPRDALA